MLTPGSYTTEMHVCRFYLEIFSEQYLRSLNRLPTGGPFFRTNDDGSFTLLTLVSWGDSGIDAIAYDVGTNVLYFMEWLKEELDK